MLIPNIKVKTPSASNKIHSFEKVNSKSFVARVLLQINRTFELTFHFKDEIKGIYSYSYNDSLSEYLNAIFDKPCV